MTTTTSLHRRLFREVSEEFLGQGSASRWSLATAVILLTSLIPSIVAASLDTRELNGANVWLKPIKFELSLGIHFLTLAIALRFLDGRTRESRLVLWSMIVAAIAAIGEVLYIAAQAARGRASHFNSETAWESFAYGAMGVGATAIVAGSFIIGLLLVLDLRRRGHASGTAIGAALGLLIGSAATLIVGFALGSDGGHWIGGDLSDASGLPLFGWSTTGGDLRVSHFFATHAMQVLLVIGWVADVAWRAKASFLVYPATAVYSAIIITTFLQAQAGIPFIR
jgi:hypothetical protein